MPAIWPGICRLSSLIIPGPVSSLSLEVVLSPVKNQDGLPHAHGNLQLWASVAAITVGSFAYVTAEFIPVGVLPAIASSFGISTGDAGLMLTMPGLLAALGAPCVLLLAGNLNRRTAVLALCSLLVVACGISAVATEYGWMLFSRCLFGFGLGGFWSLAIALAPSLVPKEMVTKATAAIFAGFSVALIVGVPIGTFVAEVWGWRATFVVVGLMGALTVIAQYFFLPSLPAKSRLSVADIVAFCRPSRARISILLIVLAFIGHFATYTFVAPLLHHAGINGEGITLILLGFGLICFFANLMIARILPDKLYRLLIANMLTAAIALLSFLLFADFATPVVLAIAAWAFAWGSLPLCLTAFHRKVPTPNEEASSVVFVVTAQVAIAAGSGFGGSIVDHWGLLTVFVVGGCIYLTAIGFVMGQGRLKVEA